MEMTTEHKRYILLPEVWTKIAACREDKQGAKHDGKRERSGREAGSDIHHWLATLSYLGRYP